MMTIVDIETKPNAERFERLLPPYAKAKPTPTPFVPEDVKTGNLKDADKIEAKIEEAREKHEAKQKKDLEDWYAGEQSYIDSKWEKAALSPAYADICAIGWQHPGCPPRALIVGEDVESTFECIHGFYSWALSTIHEITSTRFGFWDASTNHHSSFDVNFLEKQVMFLRSEGYDFTIAGEFYTLPDSHGSRWRNIRSIFGRNGGLFADAGYPDYLGLDRAVEVFGGYNKVADVFVETDEEWRTCSKDALEVSGETFWKWIDAGEFTIARAYLENDLCLTRYLANLNPFKSPSTDTL